MSTINPFTHSIAPRSTLTSGPVNGPTSNEEKIFRKALDQKQPQVENKKERKIAKKEGHEEDFLLGCCLGALCLASLAAGPSYPTHHHYHHRHRWGYRPMRVCTPGYRRW